jgi:hypothetical protein
MPPSKREIRNALTKGVGGRPPLLDWSREDIKRHHPAKLSDAEILVMWDRFGKFEPRPLLYRELIRRGLWRVALRDRIHIDKARCFIDELQHARGPSGRGFDAERDKIIECGVLEHLRKALAALMEVRQKIEYAHRATYVDRHDALARYYRRKRTLPTVISVPAELLALPVQTESHDA